MHSIDLSENKVLVKDQYKLIKSTTHIKNSKGELKDYTSYNCSFPYPFYEMLNFPKEIYFYERMNRFYITNEEPPDYYIWKKINLQNRKNKNQNSSKENENKKWAKLMAIPKLVMGELDNFMTLHYCLHCNERDYVTNRIGLLEVSLSRNELNE